MGQATLDDDDLFGEAADELRDDVHEHLDRAENALPTAEDIWEVNANNVLGVLNTLRTNLNVEEAEEDMRQAKKWFALGQRAEAFEDGDALDARIAALEDTIAELQTVQHDVGVIASTLPGIREKLKTEQDAEEVVAS